MRFARKTEQPAPRESIVPMINVVFLLLIFFLMSARLAPPQPQGLTLPASGPGAPSEPAPVLHMMQDGTAMLDGLSGAAAWEAIASNPPVTLLIRADARLEGAELARALARLAALGITDTAIAAVPGARP